MSKEMIVKMHAIHPHQIMYQQEDRLYGSLFQKNLSVIIIWSKL